MTLPSKARAAASSLLLGVLVWGGRASADEPAEAVYLKDGAVIRGKITEMKEGSHVSVALAGGQVARVRWDVVLRIEKAGGPPPVAPTPAAPAARAVGQSAATALVHIEAPEPVQLELVQGREGRIVCTSPCDIALPLDGAYRVTGSMRASKTFALAARAGERVVLEIDPSSRGAFAGGIVLLSVGGATFLLSGLVYLVASAADAISGGVSGVKTGSLAGMGIGVAGVAGGIVLIATNGSSGVDQRPGGAAPASAKVRRPLWADAPTREAPSAFTLPLTFSF